MTNEAAFEIVVPSEKTTFFAGSPFDFAILMARKMANKRSERVFVRNQVTGELHPVRPATGPES